MANREISIITIEVGTWAQLEATVAKHLEQYEADGIVDLDALRALIERDILRVFMATVVHSGNGECSACHELAGYHAPGCKFRPKKGNAHQCDTCDWWNRNHAASCRTKGYQVGSRQPTAPAAPAGPPEMCCGGTAVRADCPYHQDPPATERSLPFGTPILW